MSQFLALQDIQPSPQERVDLPFGEWLPDMPTLNNPGALEALNVIPADNGNYIPFYKHNPLTPNGILPFAARGAATVVAANDVVQVYAGTNEGVYSRVGGKFVKIYSTLSSNKNNWKFIRVNNAMVALHAEHQPVANIVGASALATVLGGTPPTASCGAQVGDFLMLGDLLVDPDDGGAYRPTRVRWSGFNNIDSPWITSLATQADFQDMPSEGGRVVAIAGRDFGTIFQQRMISRASYVGPPTVWNFETVEDKRGCIARDSVVDIGAYTYFIAEDGFFVWNGTNATPIANGKVNRYFFKRLNYSQRSRIMGAVDFVNGCVMWAFPTDSTGQLREILIYSYRENRWSRSNQALETLVGAATSNITLEDLPLALELYTESFDSDFYTSGGRAQIGGFNIVHTYGLFNGITMSAQIDTGEFSGPDGLRLEVNNSRPLINVITPDVSVQCAARDQLMGQDIVWAYPVNQEADGQCPILADGRYIRFRLNIPAGAVWQHASGINVSRNAGGQY